ncbi:MAG: hypothetical protein ABIR34_04690 [Marmoricola sp.]
MVAFPDVSRRTLLGLGAGAVVPVVTGCTVNNPVSHDKTPKPTTELAPDVAVATRALAEIMAVRTAASRTLSRYPATRPGLASVVSMHRAHEASLADAVPDRARPSATPAPYVVPRRRDAALKRLATREQRLHDMLDGLALRAQSGDFARLLASMGAAVNQRLAGWPS